MDTTLDRPRTSAWSLTTKRTVFNTPSVTSCSNTWRSLAKLKERPGLKAKAKGGAQGGTQRKDKGKVAPKPSREARKEQAEEKNGRGGSLH